MDMQIKTAKPCDEGRILDAMTLAFAQDPIFRWIYPEPDRYMAGIRGYVQSFGGRAFLHNTVFYIGDFFGVAMWLPPGVLPDEEGVVRAFDQNTSQERIGSVHETVEQMGKFHPVDPVWHLAVLGVDSPYRGQGIGKALLQHTLERIDKEKGVIYLEASSTENVRLYQRHGFEPTGTIHLQDNPITLMIRQPLESSDLSVPLQGDKSQDLNVGGKA